MRADERFEIRVTVARLEPRRLSSSLGGEIAAAFAATISPPKPRRKRRASRRGTATRMLEAPLSARTASRSGAAPPVPGTQVEPQRSGRLMYAMRRWSVRRARRAGVGLSAVRARAGRVAPGVEADRLRALEKPVAIVEKAVKEFLLRLRMCGRCVLGSTGMSLSDELPEESARRALRRRALRWPLRGEARRMRVHSGLKRSRAAGACATAASPSTSCSLLHRPAPRGPLVLACGGPRKPRRPEMKFEDEPVPGYPLPILPGTRRLGAWSACCAPVRSPSRPSSIRPELADPEASYRRARIFDGSVDAIDAKFGPS